MKLLIDHQGKEVNKQTVMSSSMVNITNNDNPLIRPKPKSKTKVKNQKKKSKTKEKPTQPVKTDGQQQQETGQDQEENPMDDDELIERLIGKAEKHDGVEVEEKVDGDKATETRECSDIKTNEQQQNEGRNIRKSRNRHRERLARREESSRNETELLKQQTSGLPNQRQIELDNINLICKTLDLKIVEMAADGHCLFSAVADQLNFYGLEGGPFDYHGLRLIVSSQMRNNKDDFINHMISSSDSSDENRLMSDEEFFEYCDRIARTAEWGGEPEIMALSRHFKKTIHVIQAVGPILKFSKPDQYISKQSNNKDQEEGDIVLRISYHRRAFGLGEHYNSLRPNS
ncbi:hypothetical protein BY996DRAFT_7730757 [Phakopsora pachyrhizi]|nr:hypothetical protein BY996DRAFT_8289545 [Phakopsora pachyrhizi]KAI8447208.1 hypothetical protein BY996DRAFT_7730757 [Phakopsora pachyrhizi]